MKDSMPKLKKLASANNCTVEDDRGSTIIVRAIEGFAFEEGERLSICEGYGSCGEYEPEWRQEAIREAIDRLEGEPPEPF